MRLLSESKSDEKRHSIDRYNDDEVLSMNDKDNVVSRFDINCKFLSL